MKFSRAFFRLLLFATYTMVRIVQIVFLSLIKGEDPHRSLRIRRSWARWLLPKLGLQITTEGEAPDFPCIVMSNHRSYMDPVILVRDIAGFPVSKAEVASWPIIGYGAKLTGVLFLKRESASSRRSTLNGISAKVREGFPVILFPEGTTHDHPTTIELKRGGFQLAADGGFPIVPVMMEYGDPADYWIGNDTFLPHFFRRFSERRMIVNVRYGEPLSGNNAQELQQKTRTWIDHQLVELHRQMKEGEATS